MHHPPIQRHAGPGILATVLLFVILSAIGCGTSETESDAPEDPTQPRILGELADKRIDEASGIIASRNFPGSFWTHNDSGDEARLFAVGPAGDSLGTLTLAGAENVDYEDIAWGRDATTGQSYLYIADMGDNKARRHHIDIYRIPEPTVRGAFISEKAEVFRFRYPDGPRDAEALIVDPLTADFTIVSKREDEVRVYSASPPHSTLGIDTLHFHHTIPYTDITAGDIHPDGSYILLKDYEHLYGWTRAEGQSVADALLGPATIMPYIEEPQGEAVTFTPDGTGYVTVSEEDEGKDPELAYYPFNRSTETPTAP